MNTPFADYLSPLDRELEIFRLSSEALDRQVALMESAADEMLEIAYLLAESAVLENHGDYNMLSDFYMEAQQEAEEKKKGAISSILDWIGRQFTKLSEWLTKVFGTKNNRRIDPNAKYNVHKDSFGLLNVLKTAGSKIIEAINNVVDAIITNKKITFGILATSVISTISNVRLRNLVLACVPVDENGKPVSRAQDAAQSLDSDNSTETTPGKDVIETTDSGISFLNNINKVCGKINQYLAQKNLDATNAQAAAKKKKAEEEEAKNAAKNQQQPTVGATPEEEAKKAKPKEESVDIENSLYDAIQYFGEAEATTGTGQNTTQQTAQSGQGGSGQAAGGNGQGGQSAQSGQPTQQSQPTQKKTETPQAEDRAADDKKDQKTPNANDQAKQVAKDNNFTLGDEAMKNLRMIASILKDVFKLLKSAFEKVGQAMPWVKQKVDIEVDGKNVEETEKKLEGDESKETPDEQPDQDATNTEDQPEDTGESAALFAYLDGEEEANLIEEGVPEEVLDTLDRLFEEM